ncbi:MAG: PAS domain-containing protein [Bacteroidota bacterium]|nr:PAS domain-containing protein [Bacteroidota bacterium]
MRNHFRKLTAIHEARFNRVMEYTLWIYCLLGIAMAFYYDTFQIAAGIGGVCVLAFYSAKNWFRNGSLHHYVFSASLGIFMAQFIYEMHGLFEMHFFAFIGSAILVISRNWRLQLPLAIIVIIHHSLFGWMQFAGFSGINFTQLAYMPLYVFIIHIALAVAIFTVCGYWSYYFRKTWFQSAAQSFKIGQLRESERREQQLRVLNDNLVYSNFQLSTAHQELAIVFNSIDAVLFSFSVPAKRFLHVSAACEKVYGYPADVFLQDPMFWRKAILREDKPFSPSGSLQHKDELSSLRYRYRIIHRDGSIRSLETRLVPEYDSSGKLVRVDGICDDVTERELLSARLANEIRQKQLEITAAVITAQENERFFLGEELHDNINPILSTARLYIDCVLSGDQRFAHLLAESKGFIGTAIEEIRKLSRTLIPPSLGDIGLVEALEDSIGNLQAVNPINFITHFEGIDDQVLSDSLKLTIFRIVQEQLNNVLKHAQAKNVWICLAGRADQVWLSIKDDGLGFDMQKKRNGVGLKNITSRTELCNGKVDLQSTPGKGCELNVRFTIETAPAPIRQQRA